MEGAEVFLGVVALVHFLKGGGTCHLVRVILWLITTARTEDLAVGHAPYPLLVLHHLRMGGGSSRKLKRRFEETKRLWKCG
jgi:hypothetical protein